MLFRSGVYDYLGHVVVFTSKRGFDMLDSGFMPPFHLCSSDRNVTGWGCVVATREKTAVFLSTDEDYCLHYVLFLIYLSVAHKAITSLLQLNTKRFAG